MSGDTAGPGEWAARCAAQGVACAELGSPLYGRLLELVAGDVGRRGATWEVLAPRADLRFGQAGPLRLLGTAHRLALAGAAPGWAAVLPSCGGTVPDADDELARAWADLVAGHGDALTAGLDREVQTNEVGRAAGLGLGLALAGLPDGVDLVELGCSGGLNLRLDHFRVDLAGAVVGDAGGSVRLRPEVTGEVPAGLRLPAIGRRVGLDPHPVDVTTEDGRLTLLSFVWPDQEARLERVRAAVEVARRVPADLRRVTDTAAALRAVLAEGARPLAVQHSVVWQYVPTDQRWAVTEALEQAGERATAAAPLAWVRYEPDEWDRRRSAVRLRTWPGGGDRLVALADYHGRWLTGIPGC